MLHSRSNGNFEHKVTHRGDKRGDHVIELDQLGVSTYASSEFSSVPPFAVHDQVPVSRKDEVYFVKNFIYILYGVCGCTFLLAMVIQSWLLMGVICICAGMFYFTQYLTEWILEKETGTQRMNAFSDAIQEGADGYLFTQYWYITKVGAGIGFLLFLLYLFRTPTEEALSSLSLALLTLISFCLGCTTSGLAGYIGVWVSVRVNIRVAQACNRHNFISAFLLAFRGGAISSVLSTSLCVLGLTLLYLMNYVVLVTILGAPDDVVPTTLGGYGFGASFVALYMQLGGGIYTKASDIGADLVGKVEQSIPEDDPRNPATIADNVGDNVGDCAGSMADVFETISAEIIGTMILAASVVKKNELDNSQYFVLYPLILYAVDLIVGIVGILSVKSRGYQESPLTSMQRGYHITLVLTTVCLFIVTRFMLYTPKAPDAWWKFSFCGFIGIILAYILMLCTQYFTDYHYAPVLGIAKASKTGAGTNIIQGMSVGLESVALPLLAISISLLGSYALGNSTNLLQGGVFGTAIATIGMLSTAVFILSENSFGPIADNAGGITMEIPDEEGGAKAREIADKLDAIGNVTKASTKGFSVGGSALAAFVIFHATMDELTIVSGIEFVNINLARPEVLVGGIIGVMTVFLFSGWSMESVGRTAQEVVVEVRRQFKEIPGILERTAKPQYGKCVSIVTSAALREMRRTALLVVSVPVLLGFSFKLWGTYMDVPNIAADVLLGYQIFSSLTGLAMSMFLSNAGGAWDNGKKYIEAFGVKGSIEHKAAVVGDTVGDPFKDTSGPGLSCSITLASSIILLLTPFFMNPSK